MGQVKLVTKDKAEELLLPKIEAEEVENLESINIPDSTTKFGWLINKLKNKFYPITHSNSVLYGDNTTTVTDEIKKLKSNIIVNLAYNPYTSYAYTGNVSRNINDKKEITLDGYAKYTDDIKVTEVVNLDPNKKYKILGIPEGFNEKCYIIVNDSSDNQIDSTSDVNGIIVTGFSSVKLSVRIIGYTTFEMTVIRPMITENLEATYDDYVAALTDSGESKWSNILIGKLKSYVPINKGKINDLTLTGTTTLIHNGNEYGWQTNVEKTDTVNGSSELALGNGNNYTSSGSAYGALKLYGKFQGSCTIVGGDTSSNYQLTLPCSNGTLALSTTSSKLVKENIKDISLNEAKKILDTRVVTFDYKKGFGDKKQCGVIAEEIQKIIPSCVDVPEEYDENEFDESKGIIGNRVLSVDYRKLVPYLIKMVQEQQKEIDELKEVISNKN